MASNLKRDPAHQASKQGHGGTLIGPKTLTTYKRSVAGLNKGVTTAQGKTSGKTNI